MCVWDVSVHVWVNMSGCGGIYGGVELHLAANIIETPLVKHIRDRIHFHNNNALFIISQPLAAYYKTTNASHCRKDLF